MKTSTKNALITAIISACSSLIVGIIGLSVGSNIISTMINSNINQNANSNFMSVTFRDGTVQTYSEDDIINIEEDRKILNNKIDELEQANQKMLSNAELMPDRKYENYELLSNGEKENLNDKNPIIVINGINYYPEEILNQLNGVTVTYNEDENIISINQDVDGIQ